MADSSSFSADFKHRPSRQEGFFCSFWMAGYEGAEHLNSAGFPLSMNEANQHWQQLDADYALLARFGIRTVRESIGWRITEQHGDAGFKLLHKQAEMAEKHGIEVIWSLMHYGWPDDIDLLSPAFVQRFAAFSQKVAGALRRVSSSRHFYQPINEISFLAWALSATGLMQHPLRSPARADGSALKVQLVRAALRACEVIGNRDPGARFMHSDPLIHVSSSSDAPLEAEEAARRHSACIFETWDMLCGRAEPQLVGSMRHPDVVGINYYHDNQWAYQGQGAEPLHWHLADPRRKPLNELVDPVWQRYRRPMMVAETSHVGEGRGEWLDDPARKSGCAGHAACRSKASACTRSLTGMAGTMRPIGTTAGCGRWMHHAPTPCKALIGAYCASLMPSSFCAGKSYCPVVRGLQRKFPAFPNQLFLEDLLCPPSLFFHTCAGTLSTNGHNICCRAWRGITALFSWKSRFQMVKITLNT